MKYQWRTVTKEEIRGGVEVWLHGNQDNKAQVPSQSPEVDHQKQYKEGNLQLWMPWKSQKDETGHHADIPSQGYLLLSAAFRAPKWDSWGNENPGEETIFFCHGNIDAPEPEETVEGKCPTSIQCRNPLYSTYWVFQRDRCHPDLIHLFVQKWQVPEQTGIFALSGSSPSLSMSRLYQRKLLIALGLTTPTFFPVDPNIVIGLMGHSDLY